VFHEGYFNTSLIALDAASRNQKARRRGFSVFFAGCQVFGD